MMDENGLLFHSFQFYRNEFMHYVERYLTEENSDLKNVVERFGNEIGAGKDSPLSFMFAGFVAGYDARTREGAKANET